MSKELYIAAWEDIVAKLTDAGCEQSLAEEIADEKAYDLMRERLFDQADNLRKRAKEAP